MNQITADSHIKRQSENAHSPPTKRCRGEQEMSVVQAETGGENQIAPRASGGSAASAPERTVLEKNSVDLHSRLNLRPHSEYNTHLLSLPPLLHHHRHHQPVYRRSTTTLFSPAAHAHTSANSSMENVPMSKTLTQNCSVDSHLTCANGTCLPKETAVSSSQAITTVYIQNNGSQENQADSPSFSAPNIAPVASPQGLPVSMNAKSIVVSGEDDNSDVEIVWTRPGLHIPNNAPPSREVEIVRTVAPHPSGNLGHVEEGDNDDNEDDDDGEENEIEFQDLFDNGESEDDEDGENEEDSDEENEDDEDGESEGDGDENFIGGNADDSWGAIPGRGQWPVHMTDDFLAQLPHGAEDGIIRQVWRNTSSRLPTAARVSIHSVRNTGAAASRMVTHGQGGGFFAGGPHTMTTALAYLQALFSENRHFGISNEVVRRTTLTQTLTAKEAKCLNEGRGNCVICMDEFVEAHVVRRLPCLCVFHKECVDRHFKDSGLCPICRSALASALNTSPV